MNALYIGILTEGTTSKMRADTLFYLTPHLNWHYFDSDKNFHQASRVWKTIAFRLRIGLLVERINRGVTEYCGGKKFELIWVDKGVYLWPETLKHLRKHCVYLIHFTPDTAFYANRSRHFYASVRQYDLLVTTKSFELKQYYGIAESDRVYLTTQAYDARLHRPLDKLIERKKDVVFIGLCERDREVCIETLLASGVPVRLGGKGWKRFVKKHYSDPNLQYLGESIFGDSYVLEYSSTMVGLGLLSKRFPELHTTRTFEIPAIGAVLATERNVDTTRFFGDDEVIFFDDYQELAEKLVKLLTKPVKIEGIALKGNQRVIAGNYDYASVLSGVLRQLSFSL